MPQNGVHAETVLQCKHAESENWQVVSYNGGRATEMKQKHNGVLFWNKTLEQAEKRFTRFWHAGLSMDYAYIAAAETFQCFISRIEYL